MVLDPERPEVYVVLAEAQVERKKYKYALMTFEEGLNLDPTNDKLMKLQDKCRTKLQSLESAQSVPACSGFLFWNL